jgi:hypothetical protein
LAEVGGIIASTKEFRLPPIFFQQSLGLLNGVTSAAITKASATWRRPMSTTVAGSKSGGAERSKKS